MTLHSVPTRSTHPTPATGPPGTTGEVRRWPERARWWPVVALAPAVAFALLTAWWTPRGPTSTLEALTAMALGLAVGVFAGRLLRSRWAVLAAPLVFVVTFELARWPVEGPTVDGLRLTSMSGLAAVVLGRGVHGLIVLLPMMLGAAWGARAVRDRIAAATATEEQARRRRRRFVAQVVAGSLVLVGMAVAIAQPAETDPIVDADGSPVPGSVAELITVDVGEHDLALMVRGVSTDNPVLLFLAGGPGGTELGAMRRHSADLEDHFVVATLDQRGTGRSYGALDPTSTLTVDGAVADVVAVTDYLRDRFGEEQVYLVGQSWGTILGVLTVQERPDLFAAFVGVGQMVDPTATDRRFYEDTLEWARRTGDDGLVDTLVANGPPPYSDAEDYVPAVSSELQVYPYDHGVNDEGSGQMGENILVEEYSLLDKLHIVPGVMDTFALLYPQVQGVDFRTQVPSLEVPVYLVQGRYEAPGRAEPALEWFDALDAPAKELFVLDTSGHRPLWEQPEEFRDVLTETVLPQTQQR